MGCWIPPHDPRQLSSEPIVAEELASYFHLAYRSVETCLYCSNKIRNDGDAGLEWELRRELAKPRKRSARQAELLLNDHDTDLIELVSLPTNDRRLRKLAQISASLTL